MYIHNTHLIEGLLSKNIQRNGERLAMITSWLQYIKEERVTAVHWSTKDRLDFIKNIVLCHI